MSNIAVERANMPQGANKVLDRRTVEHDNSNLLKYLKGDIKVLDVGCGSGSITAGIAAHLAPKGMITGIDVSEHLVAQAKQQYAAVDNLQFSVADINDFAESKKFDLITSARVLQWLPNPLAVIGKMKQLLNKGGYLSILDYNHTKIEWVPQPPAAMRLFYNAFLQWRKDAGFDNEIADNLENIFRKSGFEKVSFEDQSEITTRDDEHFESKAGIWTVVAETRGHQLVKDNYITENERLTAIEEYDEWVKEEGQLMKMYLLAVEAKN
jgi:ubiquinone/menaquinone biosynthesis C-methylase UbiE